MNQYPCQAPNTPSSGRPGKCPDLPACPACGQLECLCRPRFFAGQLLTEEDLNRLERYIVEKNKLHNRYLHGWGVVCGLEVVCSPCQNLVQVKSGYALSPCGEDIIVCHDDPVDVCALIQACRPVRPPACDQPQLSPAPDCQDLTEDWVLAVCYDERPSRGITALRGGSSTCGCNSSPKQAYTSATNNAKNGSTCRSTLPNPPPQCEPTLTCESYFYRAYKVPPPKKGDSADPGALVTRIQACLQELSQQIAALPGGNSTPQQRYAWCCSFKQTLQDFLVTQGSYDCQLADKLAILRCPDPSLQDFETEWHKALQQLVVLLWEFLQYCFCSSLLPPCPEPVTTDCVPLATITVRRRDCRILKVCNWGPRKFAITLPNLGYWLSFLNPFVQFLRDAIVRLCCAPLPLREAAFTSLAARAGGPVVAETLASASTARTASPSANLSPQQELTTLLYQAIVNPERGFNAQTLLVLNALGATDARSNPVMSPLERDNPLQFLLANQVAAPLIMSSMPDRSGSAEGLAARMGVSTETTSSTAAEMAALRAAVEELQSTVKSQQAEIKQLKKPSPTG